MGRGLRQRFDTLSWAVAVVVAVGFGLAFVKGSLLPLLVVVLAAMAALGVTWPASMLYVVFVTLVLDGAGLTGASVAGVPITLSKLAVLLAIGTWLVHAVATNRRLLAWTPLTGGMFAVLASMSYGVALSEARGAALIQFSTMAMLTILVHLVYAVLRGRELPRLVGFMALSTGVVVAQSVLTFSVWERAAGTFLNPNGWATVLLLLLPVLVGGLAHRRTLASTAVVVTLLLLMPVSLVQSASRAGAMVGVGVMPFVLYLLRRRRWLLAVGIGVALVGVAEVANPERLAERYEDLLESSATGVDMEERMLLFKAGVELLKEHWLWGIGLEMFPRYQAYWNPGANFKIAHNSYLNVAVEQGVFGMVTHAWFLYQVVRVMVRSVVGATTMRQRQLAVGLVAGLLSFAAMSATLNTLVSFAMAWFILGLLLVLDREVQGPEEVEEEEPAPGTGPPVEVAAR